MKNDISLKSKDTLFLDDSKIYSIISGKIIVREVFSNGKVVNSEVPLSSGDIVGNFFNIYGLYKNITKGLAVEIEAIEDTIINELNKTETYEKIKKFSSGLVGNLMEQMLKKQLINICHHIYSKKGYILAVLLMHSKDSEYISKDLLNHEVFNLSRSQFFMVISELKKEGILEKKQDKVKVDKKRAEKFLELEI
ncbi:hypothetical protein [Cetobacterium sp.]|uniref:hypothetical protein n=1 Tax=Cetobacterium sp. TaxID=2071632 RepID=UPI003F2F1225